MNKLSYKQIYLDVPPVLDSSQSIALDLELSGLREEQLHRPAGNFVSLAGCFDGENVYLIQDEELVQQFMDNIKEATWIFHNSTFDIGHLKRWATFPEVQIRDTLLIDKILWSDYYENFGLNDLVRRYLKKYMAKDVRAEFSELEGRMTNEQIEYAALDVIGTWLVDKEQQKILDKKDQLVWEKIDMPMVWIATSLAGFPVNKDGWMKVSDKYKERKLEIEDELGRKYGHTELKKRGRGKSREEYEEFVPFNPSSPSQVLKLLQEQGLNISSTGDEVLAPFVEENDTVAKIVEYRGVAKRYSTYGEVYLEKFVEPDGKIYPSLNVSGAATGRSSCRSPNLQQIPNDEEYRDNFIAGEGKKLIVADYSSQEPRIFAYLTQDPTLIEIINSGLDIYCEVAKFAFNETITKADKKRRNHIKSLVLGLMYGLSPYGFAVQNEVSLEEAEGDFNRFFEAFPVAAKWVEDRQNYNPKYTLTILGRKCHLHPYNSQRKRNILNNPIQGTAADMTKLAMREFRKECIANFGEDRVAMIIPIHDEIVAICDEDIAAEVQECMQSTMISVAEKIHPGIVASVDAKISDSWWEGKK